MINKKSIEIYTLTEDREKRLWQDCIFIFDSSALLEFYSYSDKVRESIFEIIFPKLVNRLWIPQQVEYEYLKNRENVIEKPIQKYNNLIKINRDNQDSGYLQKIEESIGKINDEIKIISTQFKTLKETTIKQDKHPYFENETLINNLEEMMLNSNKAIEEQLNKFKDGIENFKTEIDKEILNRKNQIQAIYQNDSVLEGFKKYFEVGEGYSFDELIEIVKEGELRYRSNIPPGYEDNSGKNKKEGISIYGDLILWKQIIAHTKQVKKNIILIINDVKPDWCYKRKNNTIDKPREDLIRELYTITGMELWMYTFSDFLYKSGEILNTNVDNEVLQEVEEVEREKANVREKLIVLCQEKLDAKILEVLSERILAKFQINKEIIVLSVGGIPILATAIDEDYLKLFHIDVSNIIIVTNGDDNPEQIKYYLLSKGVKDDNLIIINPCIEYWLLSNNNIAHNNEIVNFRNLQIKIRNLAKEGNLDFLIQVIDIEKLIERDLSFAKYVNALIK